ncbi:MAG: dTDP-4-dehydrorhamnose reductase [Chloroflexi bacterium]|nr:dTDP-4-dehydrorhamnose reductase [Chloroflexota bacterium]
MRVVVTGADGQLGTEICQTMASHDLFPLTITDCDVADLRIIEIIRGFRPDLVIHTAALTDVDGCALNPERGYAINALGTRNVALACQRANAEMLYLSTNEVFDGAILPKRTTYYEFDRPNPINAYGMSKLAGEAFVQMLLSRFYIVRTAWLFGRFGMNFVKKMMALADQHGRLRVVDDETSSPTYATDLAGALGKLIETHVYGTYHFVNSGGCSRWEYAKAIMELSGRGHVPVEPIKSSDFARPSRPPPHSPLHNFCGESLGISLRPWQEALAAYFSTTEKGC